MKLILMRGCSGSGKSTLARTLAAAEAIFSTDDLFMVDGEYRFNPEFLADNHEKNRRNVEMALRDFVDVVVVDNTHTCAWEMAAYVDLADSYGYDVEIVESNTPWRFDADELFARNTHGVPREAIKTQIARYEHGVTVDDVRLIIQQRRRNQ